MYRAFNVKLTQNAFNNCSGDNEGYERDKKSSEGKLLELFKLNETVSAEKVKKILLPAKNYDVFLSHSHDDIELVKRLKKYLEVTFGLTVFVDSVYWDNIDKLKKVYSVNNKDPMWVAQHADMILTSALTEMIDSCESVFFLNTNNSVIKGENGTDSTYSPWIYHEVYTTNKIKQEIRRERKFYEKFDYAPSLEFLTESRISYKLDLANMRELSERSFYTWQNKCRQRAVNKGSGALDVLYDLV